MIDATQIEGATRIPHAVYPIIALQRTCGTSRLRAKCNKVFLKVSATFWINSVERDLRFYFYTVNCDLYQITGVDVIDLAAESD